MKNDSLCESSQIVRFFVVEVGTVGSLQCFDAVYRLTVRSYGTYSVPTVLANQRPCFGGAGPARHNGE